MAKETGKNNEVVLAFNISTNWV